MQPNYRLVVLGVLATVGAVLVLLLLRPPVEAPAGEPSASSEPAFGGVIPVAQPVAWQAVAWESLEEPFRPNDPPVIRLGGIVDVGDLIVGWGRASTPDRNQFNEMAAVFVTRDGRDWRTVLIEHGVGRPDTSDVAGIAFGPEGLLAWGSVCCGAETKAVWLSQDGLEWTRVPVEGDLDRTGGFREVIGVEDGWIAVGSAGAEAAGAIWSSSDGSTWEAIDLGDVGVGAGEIADIAVGTEGLIAVGTVDGLMGRTMVGSGARPTAASGSASGPMIRPWRDLARPSCGK